MGFIAYILYQLIGLFIFVLFAWIILGWLIAFGVLSYQTPLVANIMAFCDALTRPALEPIRKIIPAIGGIDISPIFLLIALNAVQIYILRPLMG
ncbi:YggT family protein [Parvularcula sp. IMCC14364]|uniref:YggT family protein n=1 Tax=Parvularcula sp. IMCC14364 TaxID=3067902 RepID=UPI0027403517|nr:YggT family protein [Parvularcula sp. IMCC14364]